MAKSVNNNEVRKFDPEVIEGLSAPTAAPDDDTWDTLDPAVARLMLADAQLARDTDADPGDALIHGGLTTLRAETAQLSLDRFVVPDYIPKDTSDRLHEQLTLGDLKDDLETT